MVTSGYPHEEFRPQKVRFAALFYAIAMALVLFTDMRLSLALLVGAIGMILTGVLSMDEAYESVSWKTVFLLAGLIPLGNAVLDSGTAHWIAQQVMRILGDVLAWVLQAAVAVMATFFSLVMSNVGATVLLVPMAIGIANMAQSVGIDADPRIFALTVALAAANGFILPTSQCNECTGNGAGRLSCEGLFARRKYNERDLSDCDTRYAEHHLLDGVLDA